MPHLIHAANVNEIALVENFASGCPKFGAIGRAEKGSLLAYLRAFFEEGHPDQAGEWDNLFSLHLAQFTKGQFGSKHKMETMAATSVTRARLDIVRDILSDEYLLGDFTFRDLGADDFDDYQMTAKAHEKVCLAAIWRLLALTHFINHPETDAERESEGVAWAMLFNGSTKDKDYEFGTGNEGRFWDGKGAFGKGKAKKAKKAKKLPKAMLDYINGANLEQLEAVKALLAERENEILNGETPRPPTPTPTTATTPTPTAPSTPPLLQIADQELVCENCHKKESDFSPDDFEGPAITTYAVNGCQWCADCISDDCADPEEEEEVDDDEMEVEGVTLYRKVTDLGEGNPQLETWYFSSKRTGKGFDIKAILGTSEREKTNQNFRKTLERKKDAEL